VPGDHLAEGRKLDELQAQLRTCAAQPKPTASAEPSAADSPPASQQSKPKRRRFNAHPQGIARRSQPAVPQRRQLTFPGIHFSGTRENSYSAALSRRVSILRHREGLRPTIQVAAQKRWQSAEALKASLGSSGCASSSVWINTSLRVDSHPRQSQHHRGWPCLRAG